MIWGGFSPYSWKQPHNSETQDFGFTIIFQLFGPEMITRKEPCRDLRDLYSGPCFCGLGTVNKKGKQVPKVHKKVFCKYPTEVSQQVRPWKVTKTQ